MSVSPEVALLLLALGFYLGDSLKLLASNEAVLLPVRGRWHARFGAQGFRIAGKEPWLPNPLTPHRPLFRLAWRFEGDRGRRPCAHPVQLLPALARLSPWIVNMGVCLFVLLPIGLFMPVGLPFTLAALVLLYLHIVVSLGLVFRVRQALGLTTRAWGALAFECLVCPPIALNLVRKLSDRVVVDESFTAAVARLVDADRRPEVDAQCLARLDEQIAIEDEGSDRMRTLRSARGRFLPEEMR